MTARVPVPPWRHPLPIVLLGVAAGVVALLAGEEAAVEVASITPGRAPGWRQLELPLDPGGAAAPARVVTAASGDTAAVAAVPLAASGPARLWVVELAPGGFGPRSRTVAVDLDGTGVEAGGGLAVEGRTLLVGAPQADLGAGAAWLVRDTSEAGDWSSARATRVQAPRPSPGAHFGQAVALCGRVAAVGAPLDSGMAHGVGSLWAVRDTSAAGDWSAVEVGSLWPGGVNLDDRLGAALALDGRTLAVGMPLKDIFAPSGGAVFVLRDVSPDGSFARWRTVRLRPAGVGCWEGFGRAVAVSGRTVVVGGRGAVWVFRDTSPAGDWSAVAETVVRPAGVGSSFGSAVAASGGVVLVGEPDASRSGTLSGAVWSVEPAAGGDPPRVVEVSPTGLGPFDRVGFALAMAKDRALVGAWGWGRSGASESSRAWLLLPVAFTADFESATTSSWGATTEPTPKPTPKPKRHRRR